jgi:hypothetical protein
MHITARLLRRRALMDRSIRFVWKYEGGLIESFLRDHTEWRGSPDVVYAYDPKLHGYVVNFHLSAVNSLMGWFRLSATGMHGLMRDYALQILRWCSGGKTDGRP